MNAGFFVIAALRPAHYHGFVEPLPAATQGENKQMETTVLHAVIRANGHGPAPPARERGDALASSYAATYAGVLAFIAVAHEGSFARAAERLGIGRSAVSRSVQKLEDQLDTRLFLRTTRSTSLTSEGALFYENCRPGVERMLQAIEEMQDLRAGPPRGQLRVSAPVGFGKKVVAPLLRGFREQHPGVAIDFVLDDGPPDFIADRIDVAFRNGRLDDSQAIARQLIPMQMLVCGSRAYFASHGAPQRVEDLERHRCVNLRISPNRMRDWEFKVDGLARSLLPKSDLCFNDAELMLDAVLQGEGLAQLPGYLVCELLRSGRLQACLAPYAPDERGHYVCYQSRRHLPGRVRVFVDYMIAAVRALNLHCVPGVDPGLDPILDCA